ncbi:MAG: hypothetical protein ACI4GY_10700 [Acutalibacteraceae bacterium]
MRKKITVENAVLFACTFISSLLLLTFDVYCRTEIVTDVLFINISGLKFHRMEFVSIIFSLAFLIGLFLEKMLRHRKGFVCFALSVSAVFAAVFALLNTDLFQILCPTMRISHITMSLSRILGILAGVSGIMTGVGMEYVLHGKANKNTAVLAVVVSVILSVFMQTTGLYRVGFLLAATVILVCLFLTENCKNHPLPENTSGKKSSKKISLLQFFCFAAITVLLLITPRFVMTTCGLNYLSAALIVGVFLLFFIVFSDSQMISAFGFAGMMAGSVIHYIIVHYICPMTVYSGNRVIYSVPIYLYLVVLLVTAFLFGTNKLSIKPWRKCK